MRLPDSLSPLRERPYRLLWTARTVSAIGDALIPVTVVFAILRSGGTAGTVGFVLTCEAVGQVVMLPVGGVWSDRLSRRMVLMTTDAIQAVCYGLLAFMIFSHHAAAWQFAAVYTVAGMAWAFFVPASSALVPDLVGSERLQPANAMLGLSGSAASILGPAAAGILLAVSSPGTAILIDAFSFALSFALLTWVHVPPKAAHSGARFIADLIGGWRALTARRWYLVNLLAYGGSNFALAFLLVLGPVMMQNGHGGATAWSAIMVTGSVGSIVGGLFALRVRPKRPLVTGDLFSVISVIPMAMIAFTLPTPYIALGMAMMFGEFALFNEVWAATQQQLFAKEILARITSLDWMVSLVAVPAGYAAAAPVSEALGVRTTLLCAAFLMSGPLLLVSLLPGVRSVRRRPDGTVGIAGEQLAHSAADTTGATCAIDAADAAGTTDATDSAGTPGSAEPPTFPGSAPDPVRDSARDSASNSAHDSGSDSASGSARDPASESAPESTPDPIPGSAVGHLPPHSPLPSLSPIRPIAPE